MANQFTNRIVFDCFDKITLNNRKSFWTTQGYTILQNSISARINAFKTDNGMNFVPYEVVKSLSSKVRWSALYGAPRIYVMIVTTMNDIQWQMLRFAVTHGVKMRIIDTVSGFDNVFAPIMNLRQNEQYTQAIYDKVEAYLRPLYYSQQTTAVRKYKGNLAIEYRTQELLKHFNLTKKQLTQDKINAMIEFLRSYAPATDISIKFEATDCTADTFMPQEWKLETQWGKYSTRTTQERQESADDRKMYSMQADSIVTMLEYYMQIRYYLRNNLLEDTEHGISLHNAILCPHCHKPTTTSQTTCTRCGTDLSTILEPVTLEELETMTQVAEDALDYDRYVFQIQDEHVNWDRVDAMIDATWKCPVRKAKTPVKTEVSKPVEPTIKSAYSFDEYLNEYANIHNQFMATCKA